MMKGICKEQDIHFFILVMIRRVESSRELRIMVTCLFGYCIYGKGYQATMERKFNLVPFRSEF